MGGQVQWDECEKTVGRRVEVGALVRCGRNQCVVPLWVVVVYRKGGKAQDFSGPLLITHEKFRCRVLDPNVTRLTPAAENHPKKIEH